MESPSPGQSRLARVHTVDRVRQVGDLPSVVQTHVKHDRAGVDRKLRQHGFQKRRPLPAEGPVPLPAALVPVGRRPILQVNTPPDPLAEGSAEPGPGLPAPKARSEAPPERGQVLPVAQGRIETQGLGHPPAVLV